jgi:hypothetical protein
VRGEGLPGRLILEEKMEIENAQPEKMLTLKEAAGQLGYKRSGLIEIVNRTKAGKPGPQIQFYQIGSGPIKFKQEWIDDFVIANSVEPGQIVPAKKPKRGRKPGPSNYVQIPDHWSLAV